METTQYFLACMRYIEMNPVRARMVVRPGDYRWSSYGQNITGQPGGLVTPHAEFLNLGRDINRRAQAYARLFNEPETDDQLRAIRYAVTQGRAIGSATYCEALTTLLGKPVSFVRRGRPACSVPFSGEKGSDP